ncbi:hypothetical protein FGRMN_10935 [Fusarium graminum]|nr:hypothetical protein FGRMN_10935 [Fusarium graminum]
MNFSSTESSNTASDHIVSSSTLTFFSESRVTSLADRLGTEALRGLVADLDVLIKRRVCQKQTPQTEGITFRRNELARLEPQIAKNFIQAFFTNIHPVYPFLDQLEFVDQATNAYLDDLLQINAPFCALYHAVLALGSTDSNARMAQTLRYHKSSNSDASQLRTFWTVYFIEKIAAFSDSQSSIIADEDIGCMIPVVPESVFGDYDWFTAAIRLARISSIAYSDLFSLTASSKSHAELATGIDRIRNLLDDWRYAYFNVVFAIERLALHVTRDEGNALEGGGTSLISAARTVADLIIIIDIKPYVPIFISGILPLSALFILFDDIIHNPFQARTEENIALLDSVSNYFVSLGSVSAGALPGGILSEFAGIARQYASNMGQRRFEGISRQTVTTTTAEFVADGRIAQGLPLSTYPSTCDNTSQVERDELKALFATVFPDWGNVTF